MELTQQDLDIEACEFTVMGVEHGSLWAHEWHIGTDNKIAPDKIKEALDNHLNMLNDDYRVERMEAIKDVSVKVIPTEIFGKWMKLQGKEGGANKFPRVLKNKMKSDWLEFIKQEGY